MKVQLPVRWSDHKKPLDKNDAYLKRLLDGESEEATGENLEYVYGSLILDTKDVRSYNDLDEQHCILRTYFNDSYCVALNLDDLKQVMSELTGDNITIIKKIDEQTTKPKRKSKDKDDDLLL